MHTWKYFIAITTLLSFTNAFAETSVMMSFTAKEGIGKPAGTIVINETQYGLLFTPKLKGLTPGTHGFHIHENPSCNENGMAALGHFDPDNTKIHLGPYHNGHLGDLPPLIVNDDGTATLPVLAPRLKQINTIKNRALMIHDHGDNYSDKPEKLGGGGGRMVCGLIK